MTEVEPERFTITERPNRYAGSCIECGGFIVDGQGLLARRVDGSQRWAVIHAACAAVATVPTMSIWDWSDILVRQAIAHAKVHRMPREFRDQGMTETFSARADPAAASERCDVRPSG